MNETNENNFFSSVNPGSPNFSRGNATIITLAVLLVVSIIAAIWMYSDRASIEGRVKARIDALQEDSLSLRIAMDSLIDQSDLLTERADSLLEEKYRLESQKDSLQNLINYFRNDASAAKTQVTKLQKQLKDLQTKLDEVQRKYDEVVALNNETVQALRNEIDQLNLQLQSLDTENQQLRERLGRYEQNADNRLALSVTYATSLGARLAKNKTPEATTNPKRVEIIQVKYRLSRPLRDEEAIDIKVFNPKGAEVDAVRTEMTSDPQNREARLQADKDYKFDKGTYKVDIYDEKGTVLNSSTFTLR